jgi:hypothetical protein
LLPFVRIVFAIFSLVCIVSSLFIQFILTSWLKKVSEELSANIFFHQQRFKLIKISLVDSRRGR